MSVLALLAWIGVAGVALPILWVFYRVVIAPMFDPLRELPHPPASKLFGSVPDVMKEQTCAPQMRWVEKVRSRPALCNVPPLCADLTQ